MISIQDIDEVEAMAPLSVQLEGSRLIIYLDEANAIDAEITEVVPHITDSAGVDRTAYRWTKVQPAPGGTFVTDDGNIRGYVASDTPPTWPAFCIDDAFTAQVGDIVRLYPGSRDSRTDLTVNYGIEWYFRPNTVASALRVEDTIHYVDEVTEIQFLPDGAIYVQADGPHKVKVVLNPTHLSYPGIISTDPQFLGFGLKTAYQVGIQSSAPLYGRDPEATANVGLIAPGEGTIRLQDPFNFNSALMILRDWNTLAGDYTNWPLANLIAGPLLTLNDSLVAARAVRMGCGMPVSPILSGNLEFYSGSLTVPFYTLHGYSGSGGSHGSLGSGGGWSSFNLTLTGTGIQEGVSLQGFVPGGQWLIATENQPWRAGPLFVTDYAGTEGPLGSGIFISLPYKLQALGSPPPGQNILYRGYSGIVSGMGFAAGLFVGGSPSFVGNLGNGSQSGNLIGILSTSQGGTGLNLGNVGAGLLLVTGANGAPMQVLPSVRTGANGRLQFGIDTDTWIEADMSTYP